MPGVLDWFQTMVLCMQNFFIWAIIHQIELLRENSLTIAYVNGNMKHILKLILSCVGSKWWFKFSCSWCGKYHIIWNMLSFTSLNCRSSSNLIGTKHTYIRIRSLIWIKRVQTPLYWIIYILYLRFPRFVISLPNWICSTSCTMDNPFVTVF